MPSQESDDEPKPSPEVAALRKKINKILESKGIHLRLNVLNIAVNAGLLTEFVPMGKYFEEMEPAMKVLHEEVSKFLASKKWTEVEAAR